MTSSISTSLDKVRGMFMGVFLSDALGAPHEFTSSRVPYTGKLEHVTIMNTRFQGQKQSDVAQITDDSEMTLALLRTLIADQGYQRDHVIMSYLQWANSGGWMMGKNTRALLKGIKTLKGYSNRISKVLATPLEERSQSNGTLMRCAPLALLWNNDIIIEDVNITNPHPVNQDCGLVYVSALRLALQGYDGPTIYSTIKPIAQSEALKEIFIQVEQKVTRDIKDKKGWCLHAMWCMLTCIYNNMNYEDAMTWIITSQPGSDTDTNACIAGAVLGAIVGFDKLRQNPVTAANIDLLINRDPDTGPTPRPAIYSCRDFYDLTEKALSLTSTV